MRQLVIILFIGVMVAGLFCPDPATKEAPLELVDGGMAVQSNGLDTADMSAIIAVFIGIMLLLCEKECKNRGL